MESCVQEMDQMLSEESEMLRANLGEMCPSDLHCDGRPPTGIQPM